MSGLGSIWHWLILLLLVALVFGTKRLRNIGDDLGVAVKGFRKGVREADSPLRLNIGPGGSPGNSAPAPAHADAGGTAQPHV